MKLRGLRRHPMGLTGLSTLVGLLAAAAPLAQAQSAGHWGTGENIYVKVCSRCHETHVAPRILGRNLPPAYVREVVMHGLRAMPAFRPTDFNEAELQSLTQLVQTYPAPWPGEPGKRLPATAASGAKP
jgi:mono/diheme cytochrome c family protein